jgi:Tol biopolymer transport system component
MAPIDRGPLTRAIGLSFLIAGLGACAGPAPAATIQLSSPAGASPTSTRASSGGPSESPSIAPNKTPSPSPVVPLAGEPWVVFQHPMTLTIQLIRPDGTGLHDLLASSPGDQGHPDWSPDGNRIAFVVNGHAIWTANADGSEAAALPIECAGACQLIDSPAWSPDGATIAFTRLIDPSDGDPYTVVQAIDLASGVVRPLWAPSPGEGTWWVRWSPDGQSIVVDVNRYPSISSDIVTGGVVVVVELRGSTPKSHNLVGWDTFASYPDWSPDGKRIVFTTNDLGVRDSGNQQDPRATSDLFTIGPDGSDLVQLTHNPTGATLIRNGTASGPLSTQPTWTPDGRSIIFTQVDGDVWPGYGMAMIKADGTGLAPAVGHSFLLGTHPRLRPLP